MARVFTITSGLENMGAMKTGGQGSVYKGRRLSEIFTAIKILPTPIHSESADDKNFIAFQNEVQKLKKVNEEANPNVVKILSSGITDSGNLPFIEMEFIEGPDLEELIKPPHEPIFTIKEVIKVAGQLSHALAHCHRLNVKHGDIKSNNVKFNTHTGNYVLLDFGLAVMSDEQRRSSLRHAGAIEFMAPEQNEGQMLFETDVYSFGVVLFELLAGSVPFELNEKGETARNLVMVAHMEKPPPDILGLRQNMLPLHWSEVVKKTEMQVPQWLLQVVYKCLQKKPADRFANGTELHQFIITNSIGLLQNQEGTQTSYYLQQQIESLSRENEELRTQLLFQDKGINKPPSFEKRVSSSPATNQKGSGPFLPTSTSYTEQPLPPPIKESKTLSLLLALLLTAGVVAAIYYFIKKDTKPKPNPITRQVKDTASIKKVMGEFIVTAAKAYFYNEPDENTRRNAYAIPSSEIIKAYDDRNDFIYTQITNSRGQTSKGWLRKQDMVTLAEWKANNQNAPPPGEVLSEEEISLRLNEAMVLAGSDRLQAAADIYKQLSDKNVPEATYMYANLALQGKNAGLGCNEAFGLLTNLSEGGYVPAKRTLGFLYSNAGNNNLLLQYNYDRCNFIKDVPRGSKLLLEAMVAGDTLARRWLDDLNRRNQQDGNTEN